MIDRYRKTGGFVQLVTLLESCGPTKRERFLEIVRAEAPSWAAALPLKIIDIERVFSWNDETLAEIVGALQDLCVAVTIQSAPPDVSERLIKLLNSGRRRRIDELLTRKTPTAAEVLTMHLRVIETVRKMSNDGLIRFEKVDNALFIEDNIESKLDRGTANLSSTSAYLFAIEAPTPPPPRFVLEQPNADFQVDLDTIELAALRKKLADLNLELVTLRNELGLARSKLEQIKKIA